MLDPSFNLDSAVSPGFNAMICFDFEPLPSERAAIDQSVSPFFTVTVLYFATALAGAGAGVGAGAGAITASD